MTLLKPSMLAAVLLLATSGLLYAQQGGLGRFGRAVRSGKANVLVDLPEVRKELALEAFQAALLDDLREDLQEQRRAILFGERDRPPLGGADSLEEALRARFQQIHEDLQKFDRQSEELVSVILEPEQSQRLRELRLQREGLLALKRPEVAADLKLTETQIAKVREAVDGTPAETGPAGIVTRRKRELSDEQEAELLDLLTDDQRRNWEQMKGVPFEFPLPQTSSRPGRN